MRVVSTANSEVEVDHLKLHSDLRYRCNRQFWQPISPTATKVCTPSVLILSKRFIHLSMNSTVANMLSLLGFLYLVMMFESHIATMNAVRPSTVNYLDLSMYLGRWYQVYSTSNSDSDAFCVVVDYSAARVVLVDGGIIRNSHPVTFYSIVTAK